MKYYIECTNDTGEYNIYGADWTVMYTCDSEEEANKILQESIGPHGRRADVCLAVPTWTDGVGTLYKISTIQRTGNDFGAGVSNETVRLAQEHGTPIF